MSEELIEKLSSDTHYISAEEFNTDISYRFIRADVVAEASERLRTLAVENQELRAEVENITAGYQDVVAYNKQYLAENDRLRGALAFINGHRYNRKGHADQGLLNWRDGYLHCMRDVDQYIESNFTVEYLFPTQPTTKEATTE